LSVLGKKWTATILLTLQRRPCRYRDFRQDIPDLSDKVLTERLRELQIAGLIVREDNCSNNYSLSQRGESLRSLLEELYVWGNAHAKALGRPC
jgi:DNA-binding HxlR family transcriptional regulator